MNKCNNHFCDDDGLRVFDNHLNFISVGKDTDHFYQLIKGVPKKNAYGSNIVLTYEQIQEEFELSNDGALTGSVCCSVCGGYSEKFVSSFAKMYWNE